MSKSVACRVDNTLLAPGDKLRKKNQVRVRYADDARALPVPLRAAPGLDAPDAGHSRIRGSAAGRAEVLFFLSQGILGA